jgi:hypothetical protein
MSSLVVCRKLAGDLKATPKAVKQFILEQSFRLNPDKNCSIKAHNSQLKFYEKSYQPPARRSITLQRSLTELSLPMFLVAINFGIFLASSSIITYRVNRQ